MPANVKIKYGNKLVEDKSLETNNMEYFLMYVISLMM